MGFVLSPAIPMFDIFSLVTQIMSVMGIIMVAAGLALVPGARAEMSKRKKVIEIVGVRKQVTITELSQETGLDREYIRQLLTKLLVGYAIFGYIEDDLFVRDTSGSPYYRSGQTGMYGS